ncbi:MAG: hypothetical protein JWP28_1200 [Phenylobacterium sp.]|uniref:hypothetical protein n=1 Tax=Phenylobacterium sp. TaxID=1871053 RepID=UPI00261CB194|nr:hypothetical protein [Phenylobacterium sp.]MDB5497169.1 hypothetical protein [Phenylobacterium sp.]
MRCLAPSEAETIFGSQGFSISLENQWYRSALVLARTKARRQARVAAQQLSDIGRTEHFVRTLNRWLPSNRARLLWVDHWQTGLYGGFENAIVAAAWRGLGEARPLNEAPGLYFDGHHWDEQDQIEILPSHAEALGVLTGVVAMLMITGSDGWLISADSVDRIEFWEGHFFFHSASREQLKRANDIVDEFGCVRWKTSA